MFFTIIEEGGTLTNMVHTRVDKGHYHYAGEHIRALVNKGVNVHNNTYSISVERESSIQVLIVGRRNS